MWLVVVFRSSKVVRPRPSNSAWRTSIAARLVNSTWPRVPARFSERIDDVAREVGDVRQVVGLAVAVLVGGARVCVGCSAGAKVTVRPSAETACTVRVFEPEIGVPIVAGVGHLARVGQDDGVAGLPAG